MNKKVFVCMSVNRDNKDIDLIIYSQYFSPRVRGKYWGPHENCYPEDPGEVEIGKILIDEPDKPLWAGELTEEEENSAKELLFMAYSEEELDDRICAAEMKYDLLMDR